MIRNFRVNIFLRVGIILVLALTLAYVLINRQMLFVPIAVSLGLIASMVYLIQYIEKTNRDLTHFLLSIKHGAFTESYGSHPRGAMYDRLSEALNQVIGEFEKLNTEKELHYQYLQAINENIGVAIFSFDESGKLIQMNTAAKQLINMPSFARIEHFKKVGANLFEAVMQILPDDRRIVQAFLGEASYQLSVQSREIILQNKFVRIILLQNLSNELEEKEVDAWHQLMRVLTHEIMNSVTPIVSLTSAVQKILTNADGTRKDLSELQEDNAEDVFSSLSTINSRSKGLLEFVQAYRQYATPLQVHLEPTDLTALVKRTIELLRSEFSSSSVSLQTNYPPVEISVLADAPLIEQVLINLLRNALQAVSHKDNGEITVDMKLNAINGASISVIDNGEGIDTDTMSKIFIPFFTTKTRGTGIGLSLSRQIMRLHRGNIRVHSTPGHGSIFTIELI